jgi:hypothetical protein
MTMSLMAGLFFWVSVMLGFTNKPFMPSVIMLNVVMMSVVAPLLCSTENQNYLSKFIIFNALFMYCGNIQITKKMSYRCFHDIDN